MSTYQQQIEKLKEHVEHVRKVITPKQKAQLLQWGYTRLAFPNKTLQRLWDKCSRETRCKLAGVDWDAYRRLRNKRKEQQKNTDELLLPHYARKRVQEYYAQKFKRIIGHWKIYRQVEILPPDRQPLLELVREVRYRMMCWCSIRGTRLWHNYPQVRDSLCIHIPYSANIQLIDKYTLQIGRWQWRKSPRKNSLQVRYIGTTDTAIDDLFVVRNQEMRRAIITACGEVLLNTNQVTLLQADDFGRLYNVFGDGRYVRVVCPSTGTPYWLSCKNDVNTAREAVAASFGLKEEEYQPFTEA